VAGNFRNVPDGLTKSIFATLSRHNAADLPGLVDLVAEAGLPALALSDVNFEANQAESLHAGDSGEWLMQGVRYARDRGVVLVGPHFHDFRDVMAAMKHCIVRKPEDLAGRSATHRHCLSPWRIAVVDAAGRVTPCNCAPDVVVGTLKEEAFDVGWNGPRLRAWRQAMSRGGSALCKSCPRY
jgi:MoaA/NifB/PqqE/SkfB family radical SAM enzyme